MRRALIAVLLTLAVLAVASPAAMAHPLGNFSVNHLTKVKVSADRVDVLYILDQAEIPTFQERGEPRSQVLAAKRAEITRGLKLRVNGRELALVPASAGELRHPLGQGGLPTTRLELSLAASVDDPRRVELSDRTYPDRVGWKAIVAQAGEGTAVRTDAPSGDPTGGLRRYPDDLLDSPLDRRSASFRVEPGDGSLVAPRAEGESTVTTRDASGQGFAGLFDDAASGEGVLVLLLLAAFGWGALHALSPGHGKAMVAAYLIGTRGTARHAVGLGVTVTITHTLGVFALGLVTLLLSQYILPEDLYPWLTLVSGMLVVCVGAGVLRSRIRGHGHGGHGDPHHHHDHRHSHHHHHDHDHTVTRRSLIGMGAAAGLIPCPSALVVLLGAIAQHEVALGMLLIVAFSVGLAATLTGLGLLVVYARRVLPRLRMDGRLAAMLPAASALAIVIVGFVLTAQAVPGVV
ncbi:MAG TPA: sulfite exporter TauE/SafE family protein [Thermoleophilaceae bacterium]|nr:sulfite exporter TauE/SafE family protein [Thermoleophilaceae bacterium]